MAEPTQDSGLAPWRHRLHEFIFEADTPSGKAFDVALLAVIVLSILAVMLESVASIRVNHGRALRTAEWTFTVLFSVEYVLRLICLRRPMAYARSFFGIIDLLAVIPSYLSLFVGGAQSLLVIRALRLLRVFRIFKVARYVGELTALVAAIRATRAKIGVFLATVSALVLIMGTAMYVIEGQSNPDFHNIPQGVYWAVVTVTTVGYGDISPETVLGKAMAALAMVLGYSLIIIPTGIFSKELIEAGRKPLTTQSCPACTREGHDLDARFCKYCGGRL